jgi:protein-S-isoprenylcysteine O-methyltransferase Ste14
MNTFINDFVERAKTPVGIVEIVVIVVINLCVLAILTSILINFVEAQQQKTQTKREQKSIVATGTMMLFFLFFYWLIRLKIGAIEITYLPVRLLLALTGLGLVVVGCYVNIRGRLFLGKNWANHIKIYENQTLVTADVYGLVRHPLYASLIWMFYGASLIYLNYAALAANSFIFVPFMVYRAKQEEKLLEQQFAAYQKYKQEVGMFFPKLGRKLKNEQR